ncbi:hypothetical protein PRZ61_03715 [Halomonas pacifica]|uniref:hypothetical protein n=1 Tax=Bisbaumannia pacifica TaxID=77098 RepID=UPI0023593B26|nr:hypothetical protein [Halomonas pacifica]MDC8802556.1 hypothetical protein [Halomonas pacifica]
MATRLPLYLMRDGQTRLGQGYFNPVWADLDSRLDALERLSVDWNAQVAQLRELGLKRIDDYIRPLTDEVDQLLQQAKDETDGLAQQLVDEHLLPLVAQANQLLQQVQTDTDGLAQQLVDEHIAPLLTQAQQLLGDIQGIKQSAQDDAAAIAQALADMSWEQQLADLESSVNQAIASKRSLSNNSFPRYDLANVSTTQDLDLALGNVFDIDASSPRTLEFINLLAAGRDTTIKVYITGSATVTFTNAITWVDGEAPALGDNWTILVFSARGDTLYGDKWGAA